jgi:hypothetical protein
VGLGGTLPWARNYNYKLALCTFPMAATPPPFLSLNALQVSQLDIPSQPTPCELQITHLIHLFAYWLSGSFGLVGLAVECVCGARRVSVASLPARGKPQPWAFAPLRCKHHGAVNRAGRRENSLGCSCAGRRGDRDLRIVK